MDPRITDLAAELTEDIGELIEEALSASWPIGRAKVIVRTRTDQFIEDVIPIIKEDYGD